MSGDEPLGRQAKWWGFLLGREMQPDPANGRLLQIASQCPGHLLTPAEASGARRFKIYKCDVGFFKGHASKNKIYGGSHYHKGKGGF